MVMLKNIQTQIAQYLYKNPFVILYSLLGTIIMTGLLQQGSTSSSIWESLFYAFAFGLSLGFGGDYLFEKHPRYRQWNPLFVIALFGAGYAISSFLGNLSTFQSHILFASYLLFLLTPPSVRKDQSVGFHWAIYILYALGLSISISLILLGLLSFLAWVVHQLFGIQLAEISKHIGLAFCLVFLPVNLFSLFKPPPEEVSGLKYKITSLMEKTIRFLFIPVMILYVLVLLAYAIKILITRELPNGMVSTPIAVAYGMFFLIDSYMESQGRKNDGIWKYHRYLQLSFVPLFIVMGIGIGKRISDYGFTASRFYLLIGFVFMLLTLFMRWRYRALELRRLIAILAFGTVITSVGPLSPKHVVARSQAHRFLNVISKYGNGYEKLADFKLSEWKLSDIHTANSAYEIILGYKATDILAKEGLKRGVLPFASSDSKIDFDFVTLKERMNSLDTSRYHYGYQDKHTGADERVCKAFSVPYSSRSNVQNVQGFDWYFHVSEGGIEKKVAFGIPSTIDKIEVDLGKGVVFLYRNDVPESVVDFGVSVRKFVPTTAAGISKKTLDIVSEVKGYRIKMIIDDASLDCRIPSISATLLVKIL
jgi:hypothetical protein